MGITVYNPASVHDTSAKGYSHAAKLGDLIFVAGQVAIDVDGNLVGKGDIRVQAEQVFRNLENVLAEAGSSLGQIGKLTMFLTNYDDIVPLREIRKRVFQNVENMPPNTLVVVSSLADPDFLIEVEAIAVAG